MQGLSSFFSLYNISYNILFILAFFIALMLSALKYMFYKAFGHQSSLIKVKAEILDALAVFILAYALIYFLEGALDLISWNSKSYMDLLRSSIKSNLVEVNNAYNNALDAYTNLYFKADSFSFNIFGVPIVSPIFSTKETFNQMALNSLVLNYVFPIKIGFKYILIFLDYIEHAYVSIIGLGLVLRLFSPTRALGAGLFVFGFTAYFIAPVLFYVFINGFPTPHYHEAAEKLNDFCGIPYVSASVVSTSMDKEEFKSLASKQLNLDSIAGFFRSLFLKMLFSYIVVLGISIMFLFYGTLILSRGVVAYSFIGKLSSLL